MNNISTWETRLVETQPDQQSIMVTMTPALNDALLPVAAACGCVSDEDLMAWFAGLCAGFRELECKGLLPGRDGVVGPMLGMPAMRYITAEAPDGSVKWVCVSL